MAKLGISTGTNPNDGSGDSLLAGAVKINSNFNEVYAAIGNGSTVSTPVTSITAGDNIIVSGSTGSVTITGIGTADIDTDRINVSGVVTASSFSGSGVNLTNLPSSALVGTLPAVSGANLTGIATFIDAGANITVTTGPTGVTTIASSSGSATTSNVSSSTLVVTGVSTLSGGIEIPSNVPLKVGDITIEERTSPATGSLIETPGDFLIKSGRLLVNNAANSENMIIATQNGAVELYYDNAERLKTAGYGVTVTGTTSTNQLNVTGVSTLGVTSTTNLTSQQLNVTGVSTFLGDSRFHENITVGTPGTAQQDNIYCYDQTFLYFGDGNDFHIMHDGTDAITKMREDGGRLRISANPLEFQISDVSVATITGAGMTVGGGISVTDGVYAAGVSTICNTLYIHPPAGPNNQYGIILKGEGSSSGGEINLTGPNSSDANSTYYSNIRLNKTGSFRYDLEFHSNGYTSGDIGDFVFYRRQTSSQRTERMKLTGEDGNLIISGTSSGGIVSATSYTGDGSELADGKWTLGANGTSDYTFTGIGLTQTTNDPILYLARGRVYEFVNSMGAHPFEIRQSAGGSAYNSGVTNNAVSNGTLRFEIPFDAPNTLYYQCTSHAGMGSTIVVYPNTI